MARGDFWVKDTRNGGCASSVKYTVASGTTASIVAGEMVYRSGTDLVLGVNGGSNTVVWVGPAATDSTETASARGTVWIYDNPLYIFRGRPSTSGNLSASVRNTQVTLDVATGTNGKQTIDEDDTSNGTFRIIDFENTTDNWVDFQMAILDHLSAG